MKKFNDYINEGLRDKMESKSEDEIRNIFKEKYNIEYYSLEDTFKLLNENGVECKNSENHYAPVEIKSWKVIRRGRAGFGLEIGKCVSKEHANKIVEVLKENLGEIWKNEHTYEIEIDNFSSFKIEHKDALILLSKIINDK